MNEDALLDQTMEDSINGGYGYILDEVEGEFDGYGFDVEDGRYDDDPSPYDGTFSEE